MKETIHEQFEIVRTETNTSHVEEYGALDIGSNRLADFLGFERHPKLSKTNGTEPESIEFAEVIIFDYFFFLNHLIFIELNVEKIIKLRNILFNFFYDHMFNF